MGLLLESVVLDEDPEPDDKLAAALGLKAPAAAALTKSPGGNPLAAAAAAAKVAGVRFGGKANRPSNRGRKIKGCRGFITEEFVIPLNP